MTVGRFAPTPSGKMHLGNILCALLGWLSARASGGRFLLRIEDLDAMRCPRVYADEIRRDLDRLGLDFDGEPLYQSERTDVYAAYFAQLQDMGLLYPCFCSRAELHAAFAPHIGGGVPMYAGTCKGLSESEIAARLAAGRKPSWRLTVPDETVTFTDGVAGVYSQNLAAACGDFVVRRSDGVFAYQLAVTVDDALSGVNEVVRGADLLSSTPRQIYLQTLLGFDTPRYFHIPLLVDADGRKLSKRDGDTVQAAFERYTPQEIIGAVAYAAGLLPERQPVRPCDLVPSFSWEKLKPDVRLPPEF